MTIDSAIASRISKLHKIRSGSFPTYSIESVDDGVLFAEASLGFMGSVKWRDRGSNYEVKSVISNPVTATIGMQLAGWSASGCLISGSIRAVAKKPASVFQRLGKMDCKEQIACVEGTVTEELVAEFKRAGVDKATVLQMNTEAKAQIINIGARACEVAILRLFNSKVFGRIKIEKAESRCTMEKSADPNILNENLRRNSEVRLYGDLTEINSSLVKSIVTRSSRFSGKSFSELAKEHGGIEKMPLEAFTVAELVLVDTKNGEVRKFS